MYDPQAAGPQIEPRDYGYDYAGPDFEIGPLLRNLLSIVQRNLWLIVAIITALLGAAFVVTMLQVPKYTAQATVEIQNQSDQVLGEDLDTTLPRVDPYDTERFLNTQLQILSSRTLLERVAQQENLYDNLRFLNAMQMSAEGFENEAERREEILKVLADRFEVDLPPDTRIAELAFTSTDPQVSAQIVNAFAEEFIQLNLQRKFRQLVLCARFRERTAERSAGPARKLRTTTQHLCA